MPQLSINFGHKLGWSYLSAGIGVSKVTSRADAVGTTPAIDVPERVEFSAQLRRRRAMVHEASPRRRLRRAVRQARVTLGDGYAAGAKRTQLWNISAGISIQ